MTDDALVSQLVRHGLKVQREPTCIRVSMAELREAIGRACREEQPSSRLRDLRDVVDTMVAQDAHVAAVETRERLRLVPAPGRPREILLGMETVPADRAGELLAALDGMLEEIDLPSDLLLRSLVPLLERPRVAGLAARILGRAGVQEATGALERSLNHTTASEDRHEILAALMRLGHRALGLRTFRTILIHGAPHVRRQAVIVLGDVAEHSDVDALYDMLRLAQRPERPHLAAMLYRLGDLRGYAPLARALEQLTGESPHALVDACLTAVELTGSQRFVPLVITYLELEEREWHLARARRLVSWLRHHGLGEPPVERLIQLSEQAYFSNERDEAIEWLRELLELEPRHPHGLYLEANCLKEDGKVEEALRISGVALSSDPRNWRLHRLRGSLLWDNGHAEAAVDAYDRALALNPVDPYTWYYKGYVLYRIQRYDEALPCLDRALSLKADSPYIYNQKAFCLERLGRHDEASVCYRRSLKLNAADHYTREYLGQALQAAGRLEEALDCFEQVLRAAPGREEALYRRADVLYDLERWEESAASFLAYIELRPDSYNAWFNRGLCLRFLARYADATACFEEALALRPDSANARRHLEYCRAR